MSESFISLFTSLIFIWKKKKRKTNLLLIIVIISAGILPRHCFSLFLHDINIPRIPAIIYSYKYLYIRRPVKIWRLNCNKSFKEITKKERERRRIHSCYFSDDSHDRVHESWGGQQSPEDRDFWRHPTICRRSEQIPVVPVHFALTLHNRLLLFILRAVLHHSRTCRILVRYTRAGRLEFHWSWKVSFNEEIISFFAAMLKNYSSVIETNAKK